MIAVPFIYFTLLTIYLIRKHRGIDISAFIIMVYAFSALCSILLDVFWIYDINGVCEKMPISPLATICYCGLITLAIVPFSTINSQDLQKVELQKEWLMDAFSWVLIITFFTTLIGIFSDLEIVLHSDLKEIRDDVYDNTEEVKLSGIQYLLAIPETLFSRFSPVAILFYYINIAQKRKSQLFNWVLLLSSLTPVIKAVIIAGRTQPIYWFLTFFALYFFFRPMLDKEQRRHALFPFVFFGSIVALFIAAVTIARFATAGISNDTGAFKSLLAYSGQSFINFNNFFCNYTFHSAHFDRILPLTNYFILHPGWNLDDYRDLIWSYSGMNIGVFFTFLGDLLVDLGYMGMFIFVLLFSILSFWVCKSANQDGIIFLSRLLIILVLLLMPLQGIFYYSYYKVNIGYYIVGSLIYSLMLSNSIKKT